LDLRERGRQENGENYIMSFVICATYYLGDKIKEMSYVGHVA
jgi:hypothetical protein